MAARKPVSLVEACVWKFAKHFDKLLYTSKMNEAMTFHLLSSVLPRRLANMVTSKVGLSLLYRILHEERPLVMTALKMCACWICSGHEFCEDTQSIYNCTCDECYSENHYENNWEWGDSGYIGLRDKPYAEWMNIR
jgi:hypothetical protein